MIKPVSVCLALSFFAVQDYAQSYHAFDGSAYVGVTSIYTNPASGVNQAYKWDVTVFGLQSAMSNTAFVVKNNSLLNTANSGLFATSGLRPRYFHATIDVNLLNARVAINSKNAVSLGLRLRSYNHVKSVPFYYNDTISNVQSFLHANNNVSYLGGFLTHAGWAELNMNYSKIILQSSTSSLSAGITLSYIKSLSGAYSVFNHISYTEKQKADGNYFIINQAAITAAYSANYLITNSNNTNSQNVHNFISKAPSSFGLDVGLEYLVKNTDNVNEEAAGGANYDWKIGVSIMDIGRNKFNPIDGSFEANNPQEVPDSVIQKKLEGVKNLVDARDTMRSLFGDVGGLQNKFTISLPTRLIISIDHNLGSHFFVNGQLSLNFYSTQPAGKLHTRELNLLSITPRWETQAWGFYLPVQYNTQGQFWVGAAIKLGPLLMGVHSLDFIKWFKTGTQTYNGGGYILLSIHLFTKKVQQIRDIDCPKM